MTKNVSIANARLYALTHGSPLSRLAVVAPRPRKATPVIVGVKDAVDKLKAAPCMDCGLKFPPICMDFDHRPTEKKTANVSQLVKWSSMACVLAEVAKCDLVCSNCHRIRTANRHADRWSDDIDRLHAARRRATSNSATS